MLIVCNGMPRSGSTLQYNLIRTLVEKMAVGKGQGYFEQPNEFGNALLNWSTDNYYHTLKTHAVHPEIVAMAENGGVYLTYTYRDIRDVAISYKRAFYFQRKQSLFNALDKAIDNYYSIKGVPGNVLWQRYEDVVTNVAKSVWEQARFLNLNPAESIVSEVIDECSIENSKRVAESIKNNWGVKARVLPLLRTFGATRCAYDKGGTLLHYNHISSSSGSVGIWRKEMEEYEASVLTERYKSWLQEAGYEVQ